MRNLPFALFSTRGHGYLGILLCLSSVCAQRVWVVDSLQRPGFDFAGLPAAVAAAASGDVIHLRFTTVNPVDWYSAPTVSGKSLTIAAEPGSGRPTVNGSWSVQAVPDRLTIAGLTLASVGGYVLTCTSCPGAIVLEDVVLGQPGRGSRFVDCGMVAIRRCDLTTDNAFAFSLTIERSIVSITDSTVRNLQLLGGGFGAAAIDAYLSTVSIMGSTVIGASANTNYPLSCWEAIYICSTNLVIGGNSHIEGGRFLDGTPTSAIRHEPTRPILLPCHMNIDAASTTAIGFIPSPGPMIIYDFGAQTSLSAAQMTTTLQVDQHANPPSLTVLAIGSLTTSPWTNVVGPVFIDPSSIVGYFDPSPVTGPLQRSFGIPPGLPAGTSVALQAFELMSSGRIVTSNVCVAGIW